MSVLTSLKSATRLPEVALEFAVNLQINVSSTASERTSDFSRPVPFLDPDRRSRQKFRAPVSSYLSPSSFLSSSSVRPREKETA